MRYSLLHIGFCLFIAAAMSHGYAAAESFHAEHEATHQRLQISESLTMADALQAALAQAPERGFGSSFQQYADSQRARGKSLIAGSPRLNMSYWDDKSFDDTGLREMEAGVEFDLWHWGQRRNAQQLADNLQQGSSSWQNYFQLMVAGKLRDTLQQLAIAEANLAEAKTAVADAQQLLQVSSDMLKAGTISRSNMLQSESLLFEARQALLEQEAALVDAEREYFVLTGLTERPQQFNESAPQLTEITLQHPQLRFLQSRRQQMASRVKQQRYAAQSNTTVSLGMRRERGSDLDPEIDSLGISLTIPLGRGSHSRASAAEANVALTEADVQLQRAQRQLSKQLHEVQHQLEVTNDALEFALQHRDLLQQRWQMAQRAFSLGESDIQPTILALQQYHRGQHKLRLLQLQREALMSSYKQTVGELP